MGASGGNYLAIAVLSAAGRQTDWLRSAISSHYRHRNSENPAAGNTSRKLTLDAAIARLAVWPMPPIDLTPEPTRYRWEGAPEFDS